MNKYMYKIPSGPTLVFYQDITKHSVTASVIVKYGGCHTDFTIEDKKYHMEEGVAHFLEHLLIEHSVYGNGLTYFEENYVSFNGYTNHNCTRFHLNTVHDFEENLVKLIRLVNVPNFTKEDIEMVKPAIIEEIHEKNDNKFFHLHQVTMQCLFHHTPFISSLGTESFIKDLDYDTVKLCYDTFYHPTNQMITICGNFDIEKVKALIIETYKKVEKQKINFQLPIFKEPRDVFKRKGIYVCDDLHQEYTQVIYKIDCSKFSPYEKVKLTFYLDYFLKYNFGISSSIYKKLVEEMVITNDIDIDVSVIESFLIIEIGTFTDDSPKLMGAIEEQMAKIEVDREDFDIRKKRMIIELLLREEYPNKMLEPFLDNIMTFGYEEMDTIDDIERQTFEEYQEVLHRLDFSHFCIASIIKNEEHVSN